MILHWFDIAFVVALVATGCGIIYFLLLRRFERTLVAGQRDIQRRLTALTEQITMREPGSGEPEATSDGLDPTVIEAAPADDARPTSRPHPDDLPAANRAQPPQPRVLSEEEDIRPEIHVAITAAAIAAFGNHARVRSARRIPSSDVVSPWTQQGRVIVQSSHNLRTRG